MLTLDLQATWPCSQESVLSKMPVCLFLFPVSLTIQKARLVAGRLQIYGHFEIFSGKYSLNDTLSYCTGPATITFFCS